MGKLSVTEVTKKRLISFILLFTMRKIVTPLFLKNILSLTFHEAERISFQRKTNTTCVSLQIQKSLRNFLVVIYLSISHIHCGRYFQKMYLTTAYKELKIEWALDSYHKKYYHE